MSIPYFDIPLNLPHAGRIAYRLVRLIDQRGQEDDPRWFTLAETAERLDALLSPCRIADEDPPASEADEIQSQAAKLGRHLTAEIVQQDLREDRVGQCIRNLFECLALGEEGATLSLQAGENPGSLQRPV